MPEGLFQGLASGLVGGLGQGILDHSQRQHEEQLADKRARLSIIQHAFDSGKLDEQGEDAALSQLLELTSPAGSKGGGKGKVAEEGKKLLGATMMPIRLLRKLEGKKQDPAAPSSASLPQAPQRGAAPQQGGLPQAPQRSSEPFHVLSAEEQQTREDTATKHKDDIANQSKLDYEKKARDQMTEEDNAKIDSDFSLFEKYYGKKPDDEQRERILEKHGIISPKKAVRAPNQLGNVKGSDLDPDTMKQFGLDANKLYKHTQDPETGADHFYPIEQKLSASEQKMKDDIDQMRASDPKLANASDEVVRRSVLVGRAQKARMQMASLQETLTGKKLTDQMRSDIINGKVTPTSARAVLSSALQTAKALNSDPSSEHFMRGIETIQDSLLNEAGYDRTELMQASGGKTSTGAGATSDDDPLGILPTKKK